MELNATLQLKNMNCYVSVSMAKDVAVSAH